MSPPDQMPARTLEIRETVEDGCHTLAMVGELDIASSPILHAAVTRAMDNGGRALRLDLRELRFIDSTGLHAILTARELCRADGRELLLIPGPPSVQRLFELTNLLEALPFANPED